jgi:hypothetical protein
VYAHFEVLTKVAESWAGRSIQSLITHFDATTLPLVCLMDSVFWIAVTQPTSWTSFVGKWEY